MKEKLAALAVATNGELFDAEYKGGEWMVDHVETHETLKQFIESSMNWVECSAMKAGEIAGLPFCAWKNVQAVKGQPRQSMSVIDFGDIRIALPGTNLDLFV